MQQLYAKPNRPHPVRAAMPGATPQPQTQAGEDLHKGLEVEETPTQAQTQDAGESQRREDSPVSEPHTPTRSRNPFFEETTPPPAPQPRRATRGSRWSREYPEFSMNEVSVAAASVPVDTIAAMRSARWSHDSAFRAEPSLYSQAVSGKSGRPVSTYIPPHERHNSSHARRQIQYAQIHRLHSAAAEARCRVDPV